MNWEDRDNETINGQITAIVNNLESWEFCENAKVFYHCGPDGQGYHEQPVIDYCNSWGDMGPLIEEIWVQLTETYCYHWPDDNAYDTWWDHVMDKYNCRQLRAAAICWLMIKEGEE